MRSSAWMFLLIPLRSPIGKRRFWRWLLFFERKRQCPISRMSL
jgi:hypothetical protein